MKLVGIVINQSLRLLGIACKGTMPEFGKNGADTVTVYMPIDKAEAIVNRTSANFKVKNGAIIPDENMYPYNTDVFMETEGGKRIHIDNRMEITKQIVVNGEVEGYAVKFYGAGGAEMKLKKEVIDKLNYFRPVNFFTRYKNEELEMVSKPDFVPLTDLPIIAINTTDEKTPESAGTQVEKTRDTGVQTDKEEVKSEVIKETDSYLVWMFETFRDEGVKVLITDEAFYNENERKFESDNKFKCNLRNTYVVAEPILEYDSKYMRAELSTNVNGTANINDVDVPVKVRLKETVVENTEIEMKDFGIIIPKENIKNVTAYIKGLTVGENPKIEVTKYEGLNELVRIKNTVDQDKNVVLRIRIKGMQVLNEEGIKDSILTIEDIADNQALLMMSEVYMKLITSMLERSRTTFNVPREVLKEYSGYESRMIGTMKLKNIDVYTGQYNRRFNVDEEFADKASKYEYCISGMNYINKLTREKLINGELHDIEYIANGAFYKQIVKIRKEVNALNTYDARVKYLEGKRDAFQKNIEYLRQTLWTHKVAEMLISGEGKIHANDKDKWRFVAGGKLDNNYVCKEDVKNTKCFESCKLGVKVSVDITIDVDEESGAKKTGKK